MKKDYIAILEYLWKALWLFARGTASSSSPTLWKGLFLWVMRRLDKIGTNCHHFLALSQCILLAKKCVRHCTTSHKSTCIPRNVSQRSQSIIVMSWKTITLFLQEILRIEAKRRLKGREGVIDMFSNALMAGKNIWGQKKSYSVTKHATFSRHGGEAKRDFY